jgi:hypothetical protein
MTHLMTFSSIISESKPLPIFFVSVSIVVLYISVVADESELKPSNISSDFGPVPVPVPVPVPPHSGKSLLQTCDVPHHQLIEVGGGALQRKSH